MAVCSGTHIAFLARRRKYYSYFLEKVKQGQEHLDSDEIKARILQEEKALSADTIDKERVVLDISECSDDKNRTKLYPFQINYILRNKLSEAVGNTGSTRNWLNLTFQEPKELCIYLVTILLFKILKL